MGGDKPTKAPPPVATGLLLTSDVVLIVDHNGKGQRDTE